jgi:hypothetical protein
MQGNKRNNRVLLGVCPLKNDEKTAEGKLSRKDTHAVGHRSSSEDRRLLELPYISQKQTSKIYLVCLAKLWPRGESIPSVVQ